MKLIYHCDPDITPPKVFYHSFGKHMGGQEIERKRIFKDILEKEVRQFPHVPARIRNKVHARVKHEILLSQDSWKGATRLALHLSA